MQSIVVMNEPTQTLCESETSLYEFAADLPENDRLKINESALCDDMNCKNKDTNQDYYAVEETAHKGQEESSYENSVRQSSNHSRRIRKTRQSNDKKPLSRMNTLTPTRAEFQSKLDILNPQTKIMHASLS